MLLTVQKPKEMITFFALLLLKQFFGNRFEALLEFSPASFMGPDKYEVSYFSHRRENLVLETKTASFAMGNLVLLVKRRLSLFDFVVPTTFRCRLQ